MIWGRPRSAEATDALTAKLEAAYLELNEARRERDEAIRERDDARSTLQALRPLRCSFCGKSQHEVSDFIAGPQVFICGECADLCAEIVAFNRAAREAEGQEATDGAR